MIEPLAIVTMYRTALGYGAAVAVALAGAKPHVTYYNAVDRETIDRQVANWLTGVSVELKQKVHRCWIDITGADIPDHPLYVHLLQVCLAELGSRPLDHYSQIPLTMETHDDPGTTNDAD